MKFKGILFDLGSTLIEFDNTDWEELERTCLRQGYNFLSEQHQLPEWEKFAEEFLRKFHLAWIEADVSLVEVRFADWVSHYLQSDHIISQDGIGRSFIEKYYQPIRRQISMLESAPEVLSEFKSHGLKIGLISNSSFPTEFHLQELAEYSLKEYFDHMIFSHDYGFRKPHPGLFQEALKALNLRPQEAVFVGDRLREDVGGAQASGMEAVLRFKSGRDYCYDIHPDGVIHSLSELPKIVEKLS
jgi:putative hydrolase of the HAD superfamily